MKRIKIYLLLGFLTLFLIIFQSGLSAEDDVCSPDISAEECIDKIGKDLDPDERLKKLKEVRQLYQGLMEEAQGKEKTLASTIAYLDNRIYLTTTQISTTEQEIKVLDNQIADLTAKISTLDKTLDDVSKILSSRIKATYKRSKVKPIYLFFSSSGFSNFLNRIKYLQVAQENDREIMYKMEKSKLIYDQQKDLKQEKQEEQEQLKNQLVSQQATLQQQKTAKNELLRVTQNNEKRYQQLLAAARAEMEAIQSIIAGLGEEVEAGEVEEGEAIASIIQGASACSTGTHLHFEVVKDGARNNPAGYLKNKDVDWDLCGWWGDCDNTFSFSGDWNWPISGRPRITQGYGMTGYAKTGAYGGNPHTGIDMLSDSLTVKAVKDGELYRGSIACGGGTLRYVRVKHKDSDKETYYVHVNY